MKDIDKKISEEMMISKELLKEKNNKIINELNMYKQSILNEDKELSESLFEYDEEYGYQFDSNRLDEDGKETVKELFENDPTFALNFLERRKEYMDEADYSSLKSIIINKLNIN